MFSYCMGGPEVNQLTYLLLGGGFLALSLPTHGGREGRVSRLSSSTVFVFVGGGVSQLSSPIIWGKELSGPYNLLYGGGGWVGGGG